MKKTKAARKYRARKYRRGDSAVRALWAIAGAQRARLREIQITNDRVDKLLTPLVHAFVNYLRVEGGPLGPLSGRACLLYTSPSPRD